MQPDTETGRTPLDLALEYARQGWKVFPCRPADEETTEHDPETGEFTILKAKSPYTPSGLRDATTTERIINRWWSDWPQAMVGVPTGEATGFWVLDLDIKKQEDGSIVDGATYLAELEAIHGTLPATVTVRTPSGGRHLMWKLPPDVQVRNRGKIGPAADVRGSGGYIIAPGSVRGDGQAYDWESRPDEPAEAPQWLLDLVVKQDLPSIGTVLGDSTTAPSTAYVEAAVEAEIARLELTTSGRNGALNDSAFALGTLVGAGVLSRQEAEARLFAAAQFNGYAAKDGSRAARMTIKSGLDSGTKHPRLVPEEMTAEEGARLAVNLIGMDSGEASALVALGKFLATKLVGTRAVSPTIQPQGEEGEPPAPPMHPDPFNPQAAGGLLEGIANWVTETAIIPVPELSLAAGLGLMAGLFGDKALGPTSTGVNLYLTTILATAGGKGHPPKAIRRVSDKLGAMGVVSNGDHTSYAAFERTLRKSHHKSVTVVMDEFGITLQDVNNKRNGSAASASIRKFLLSIYDQANSVFDGRTYASADSKPNEEPIVGPALTVLGMTTFQTFYDGLTEASISDGFLNRFIFVSSEPRDKPIEPPKLHQSFEIPTRIVEGMAAAVEHFPAREEANAAGINKWRVPFHGHEQGLAYQRWGEIFLWQHDLRWQSEQRDIRARAAENTLRLATLRAISRYAQSPAIDVSDVEWAWAIVYRSIRLVQQGIHMHMVASPAEGLRKAIVEALSDTDDIAYSKLMTRKGVRGADTRQLEEALKWLVEAEEIVDTNARPKPGRGSRFRLVEEHA